MENFTVLLVDDEKAFLDTLVKRLKKRGLAVLEAFNGPAALDIVAAHPVDVAVLDVRMPGIDGLTVLKRLKEITPLTEVIMLTGHASVEVAIAGMEAGAFDYLMKPADINELVYKLEDAYDRKKLQEEKIRKMEKGFR